jgi:uncharacterized OsmC-like protein
MQEFPHHYRVGAAATSASHIELTSPGLEPIASMGPAEFGGPGDMWSPETLLVAAVADCLILSFRAVARASRIDWIDLRCEVVGILDRVEKVTQFTEFQISAVLEIPEGVRESKAEKALEKAKKHCLVTNSMTAETTLEFEISVTATGDLASAV